MHIPMLLCTGMFIFAQALYAGDQKLFKSVAQLYSAYDRNDMPDYELIDNNFPDQQFMFSLYTPDQALVARIRQLPSEIQGKIYFMALDSLKKRNVDFIKNTIKESLIIWQDPINWNRKEYFAFKNFGTKCAHLITYSSTFCECNTLHCTSTGPCGREPMPFDQSREVPSFGTIIIHERYQDDDDHLWIGDGPSSVAGLFSATVDGKLIGFTDVTRKLACVDRNRNRYVKIKE